MPMYAPGQEPEKLRRRLDRLFAKLEKTYPDKRIVGLNADHPHWGEQVTEIYRLLDYPDSASFLAAYGFSLGSRPTGRPAVDHKAILRELKERYAESPCPDLEQLKAENPALARQFKSLQNRSVELFGATFVAYLTAEGILAGRKPRSDRGTAKPDARTKKTLPEAEEEPFSEQQRVPEPEPEPAPEPEPEPAPEPEPEPAAEPEPEPAAEPEPEPAPDPMEAVPEGIRPLLQALLRELDASYPDKVVVQSRWNHARWDRPAGKLCQTLGYRSGTAFLQAFGYRVEP